MKSDPQGLTLESFGFGMKEVGMMGVGFEHIY
jgi:hypothetical protein